jgi:ribosomal protein L20
MAKKLLLEIVTPDRKVLSQMAVENPEVFTKFIEQVK